MIVNECVVMYIHSHGFKKCLKMLRETQHWWSVLMKYNTDEVLWTWFFLVEHKHRKVWGCWKQIKTGSSILECRNVFKCLFFQRSICQSPIWSFYDKMQRTPSFNVMVNKRSIRGKITCLVYLKSGKKCWNKIRWFPSTHACSPMNIWIGYF